MKKCQLLFNVLILQLFAFCTHSAELPGCSKIKIEITCLTIAKSGSSWTCNAGNSTISTIPGSSVSSFIYSNRTDVTNLSHFERLNIIGASLLKFIPTDIGSKLSNLKVLSIQFSGLLSVNKENLKEFGNSILIIDLESNKITSINADLIEFNPNLKSIYLQGNPLRFIEPAFFANLKKLESIECVDLLSAGCTDQFVYIHEGLQNATIEWSTEDCTDESAKIETQNLINEASCLTVSQL